MFSIPVRYIHSHNCIATYHDFNAAVELAVAIVKELDEETVAAKQKELEEINKNRLSTIDDMILKISDGFEGLYKSAIDGTRDDLKKREDSKNDSHEVKEVNAVISKLKAGLISYEQAAELLGNPVDFDSLLEKRQQEEQKIKDAGLTFEGLFIPDAANNDETDNSKEK